MKCGLQPSAVGPLSWVCSQPSYGLSQVCHRRAGYTTFHRKSFNRNSFHQKSPKNHFIQISFHQKSYFIQKNSREILSPKTHFTENHFTEKVVSQKLYSLPCCIAVQWPEGRERNFQHNITDTTLATLMFCRYSMIMRLYCWTDSNISYQKQEFFFEMSELYFNAACQVFE